MVCIQLALGFLLVFYYEFTYSFSVYGILSEIKDVCIYACDIEIVN